MSASLPTREAPLRVQYGGREFRCFIGVPTDASGQQSGRHLRTIVETDDFTHVAELPVTVEQLPDHFLQLIQVCLQTARPAPLA